MSASQSAQPVVVIGASGFVGRRLVQRLAETEGLRPIAASRSMPRSLPEGVEWRRCDAADPAALAAALSGAAYAVNCVAGDAETMQAATRSLCQAAATAGLRRVVHLSSMAVYGPATGLVEETHPLDATTGWYAQAKVASEALMQDFVAAGGDAVILRPGCIHGPGSDRWTTLIGRLLQHRRIGDLGALGDGVCNLIYIDDVAAAIIAALQRPGLAGQAFNLGDPDPDSWNAYFIQFARAIGATPVRRVTPRWLKLETKLFAPPLKIGEIVAARAHLPRPPFDPLPNSLLSLWQQDIQLDHRKADAQLGFPRTDPAAAIAAAAAWFKAGTARAA